MAVESRLRQLHQPQKPPEDTQPLLVRKPQVQQQRQQQRQQRQKRKRETTPDAVREVEQALRRIVVRLLYPVPIRTWRSRQ
jgi:hypothetical protein